MRRLLVGLAALALTLSLGMTATLAASPTQQNEDCVELGGVYNKDGGTVTCTIIVEEPVGNSGKPWNGHSQQTETTGGESTKGNLDNDPQSTPLPEECTGPPGQCK